MEWKILDRVGEDRRSSWHVVMKKMVKIEVGRRWTVQNTTQIGFGWGRKRRRKWMKLVDISTWRCPTDPMRSIGTDCHEEIGGYGAHGGVQGKV